MENENLKFHIPSENHFGTLAALLSVVEEGVASDFKNPGTDKEMCAQILGDVKDILISLHHQYDVVRGKKL